MVKSKFGLFALLLAVGTAVANLIAFPHLHAQVPIHWNINGEIDRYGSKWAQLGLSFLPLAIYFLFLLLPKIDPRKESYEKHGKAFEMFRGLLVSYLSVMTLLTMLVGLGYYIDIVLFIKPAIGLLFIAMGNYMGQLRPNFFIGVRTPWTLSSEETWRRTHKVAGVVFVIMGLAFMVSMLFKGAIGAWIPLGTVIIGIIYTIVYSYVDYKKRG